MRLDECYRILELPEGASAEQVKSAYRDLTRVWHPDRFAHDPELQAKAQEKLKAINEAYETIQASPSRARVAPHPAMHQFGCAMNSVSLVLMVLGIVILFRRPSAGGLVAAAVCVVLALALSVKRRSTSR